MLSRVFVRVQFDNKNYLLSEKKLLLSGDIELNPGPAEIPNPLTYGRGFTFSSSTYFPSLFGEGECKLAVKIQQGISDSGKFLPQVYRGRVLELHY